jgi:bacteriocin-like protein
MEEQKDKRVLSIELDNDVKKVSITGTNSEEKVVMRQELSEDDLDQVTGGMLDLCRPNGIS